MSDPSTKQQKTAAKPRANMTEGPIGRHLFRMALPMVWGIAAVATFALVDTYFVAQLGTSELAAMGFIAPVVTFFGSLTLGLGVGVSSLLSRSVGSGEHDSRHMAFNALLLSLSIVGVLTLGGYFTIGPLFRLMGASAEAQALIRQYMEIWYFGMIFLVVPMTMNFVMRANGDAMTPGNLMVASAVINAILDPILIFGYLGMPRLGIEGAAWATVISRIMICAITFQVIFKKDFLKIYLPDREELFAAWRGILHVGAPMALTNVMTPLSVGLVTGLLATMGETTVGGFAAATRIEALAMIPLFAVGAAMGPVVGQNFGMGLNHRVNEAIESAARFGLIYGVCAAIVLALLSGYLPKGFSDDPHVIRTAQMFLLIVPISHCIISLSIVIGSAFNGIGMPRPSFILNAGRLIVIYLPLAYGLGYAFGFLGVFWATTLANLMAGAGAWIWYVRRGRTLVAEGPPRWDG